MDQPQVSDSPSMNMIDFLSKDYFEKFKAGQNIYDQSFTMSRLSIGEKTSEDNNNNTYIGMVNLQERLTEEIYKNQLLENKVTQLQSELSIALQHTTMLQKQNDNQCTEISNLNNKLQKQIRNNEIEKLLNAQLNKKISNLQEVNKLQLKKLQVHERDSTKSDSHTKLNQSISSTNRINKQAPTEDSTICEQKSQDRLAASAQQFYQTGFHFYSPGLSPSNQNLEKRIETTLASIRAIKQQFQQFNTK